MQAYAAGDARAFETLYDRHALPVWRFVQRSLQDTALADELVQDVWFSVVRQAAHYEPRARFRTWLFTMAHHRMVDHWRRHKPHASLDAETEDGASLADMLAAESGFGPERRLDSREQAQALLDALADLPAVQREAFLLQAEGGFSLNEIARGHRRDHRNRQEPIALRPRPPARNPGGLRMSRPPMDTPNAGREDPLLQRYQEANATRFGAPQRGAARRRVGPRQGPCARTECTGRNPETRRPTTAQWKLRALGSLAVLGPGGLAGDAV